MPESSLNCVFCGIAAGRIPANRLYEDEFAVAFLDINPIVKGHTLVIPKRHAECWNDMTAEETGAVFNAARVVSNQIKSAFDPEFIVTFARGRRIPHAHIFLLPTFKGDLLDTYFTVMEKVAESIPSLAALKSPEEMQNIARIIKEQPDPK